MKCVKEIISRSKQGITKPFKCKASDGAIYWCKGLQAGVDGLRKEWMGAGVLKALGLPTREFCALECPVGLAEAWYKEADSFGAEARNDFVDNDVNIVFGSLHIESAIDLMSRSDVSDDLINQLWGKMPACWTMRPKRTYAISREDIMQIVSFERGQYV